jgi:hypothetical protein
MYSIELRGMVLLNSAEATSSGMHSAANGHNIEGRRCRGKGEVTTHLGGIS